MANTARLIIAPPIETAETVMKRMGCLTITMRVEIP